MPARDLRKTAAFLAQAQAAAEREPRLLEAVAGAEFILARKPEMGMAVRGTAFSSWPILSAAGSAFKIVYRFSAGEVVFLGLYPAVAPEG
jgi:plasmid stabilization system protein ParE